MPPSKKSLHTWASWAFLPPLFNALLELRPVGDGRDVPPLPPLHAVRRLVPAAVARAARRRPRLLRLRRPRPRRPQRHRRRLPLRRRRILPPGDAEAALRGRQAGTTRRILTAHRGLHKLCTQTILGFFDPLPLEGTDC